MEDKSKDGKYACPCCGYRTLNEKAGGTFAVCPVCNWEDDPVQYDDPDYQGGANKVSLRHGQRNFREFGACEREMLHLVRQPEGDEARDTDWKFLE